MHGIDVNAFRMLTSSDPVQLDGSLPDGRYVYFRYRWGVATLDINDSPVWQRAIGGPYDGDMPEAAARRIVTAVLELEDACLEFWKAEE